MNEKERVAQNQENRISEFLKKQAEAQKLAGKKEKIQVCINPDSYIGREIQYQTALLHEILAEVRKNKGGENRALEERENTN